MKFLKIKAPILDKITSLELSYILVAEDQDDLSVDDKIEFFNEDNVSFGDAVIDEVREVRLGDIDKSDKNLALQLDEIDKKDSLDYSSHAKIVHFKFHAFDEPHSISTNNDLEIEWVKIFTDGGSRGNPGPSASGYVIMTDDDQIIKSVGVYLGITTNNQAEYKALKFALSDALEIGAKSAEIYMDSLLIVNQINGVYKIKNRELIPIYQDIKELCTRFSEITFTHVPRELNKLADAEVNKCLDEQLN